MARAIFATVFLSILMGCTNTNPETTAREQAQAKMEELLDKRFVLESATILGSSTNFGVFGSNNYVVMVVRDTASNKCHAQVVLRDTGMMSLGEVPCKSR